MTKEYFFDNGSDLSGAEVFAEWTASLKSFSEALSWQLVAIVTFPFILWRIGHFARALTVLHSLSSDTERFDKLVSGFADLANQMSRLHDVREEMERTRLAFQANKIETESAQEQAETLSALTPTNESPKASESTESDILPSWERLKSIMKEKFEQAKIEYDFRSPRRVGEAVAQLADIDGRQRRFLRKEDAELAIALSVGAKTAQNHGTLTDEYRKNFIVAADGLSNRLRNWRPNSEAIALK